MARHARTDQDLLAMALARKQRSTQPLRRFRPNSGIAVQGVQELQQMGRLRQSEL